MVGQSVFTNSFDPSIKDNKIEGNPHCYYRKFLETYGLLDIKFD